MGKQENGPLAQFQYQLVYNVNLEDFKIIAMYVVHGRVDRIEPNGKKWNSRN
jgi:hypothetical protein